jgi:hypothetical protein
MVTADVVGPVMQLTRFLVGTVTAVSETNRFAFRDSLLRGSFCLLCEVSWIELEDPPLGASCCGHRAVKHELYWVSLCISAEHTHAEEPKPVAERV